MQGARTVARSSCTVQAGDCRLPWMNVKRLKVSVSCRMCLGALEQLQSRCFGSPLCTFLWTSRKRTTRRDPSRSTPRGVRRGSGRSRRRFLQARHHRDLHTRIITHFHRGLAPPPRPVASLWSTQDRVLAGVRFRTDTPHDPVLSPSNRQTNPPKNSKTARKAPKPQATDAASC